MSSNRLDPVRFGSKDYADTTALVLIPACSVKTRIQAGQGDAAAASKVKDPKDPSKSLVTVPKDAGLLQGVLHIIRSKEGPLGLYKGFGASMVNTFSTRESSLHHK